MRKIPLHILRIGLALTFLWIGVLIIMEPTAWGGYMMPWARHLLPLPIDQMMIGAGVLDLVIGTLLALGIIIPLAAFLGALHVAVVLIVSGITDITVRDIAILAAALALMLESLPDPIAHKFFKFYE